MNVVFGTNGEHFPRLYLTLSAIFGLTTLATFGIERYVLETTSGSVGDIPSVVMGAVVLAVGVSAIYASSQHHEITVSILLALGPAAGLLIYLVGYHLVLPPSSDSPTWLIFLTFAGGFVALGVVGHILGHLVDIDR